MVRNIPSYLKLQKTLTDHGEFYKAKGIEDFLESQSPEGRINVNSLISDLCLCFEGKSEYFSEGLVGRFSPYFREARLSREVDSNFELDYFNRVYSDSDYLLPTLVQLELPFDYGK